MEAVVEQICGSVELQSGRGLTEDHENLQIPCFLMDGAMEIFLKLCMRYILKPQLVYLNLSFACSWPAAGLISLDVIIYFFFPFYI